MEFIMRIYVLNFLDFVVLQFKSVIEEDDEDIDEDDVGDEELVQLVVMVKDYMEFEGDIDIEIEVLEGERGVVVGFDFLFEVFLNILLYVSKVYYVLDLVW